MYVHFTHIKQKIYCHRVDVTAKTKCKNMHYENTSHHVARIGFVRRHEPKELAFSVPPP